MTNEELRERVVRLEDALSRADLPYSDRSCECCKATYVPRSHDSCRCEACRLSCHVPKGAKEWIKGRFCPALETVVG